MSVIISAQYLTGISPSLRRNAEYLFIFSPTNYPETEKILEGYVPKSERERFQELMKGVVVEKRTLWRIIEQDKPRWGEFQRCGYLRVRRLPFDLGFIK
jgi:hypothetical protein